jgi:D-alanyl-D-alanine dipeptidase
VIGMEKGFVFLDERLDGVRWDAKYATWDNFTGKPVEGYEVNRVAGSRELAEALWKAKGLAADQGYGLLLWDGYRPQRAVDCFLRWSGQPETGLTKERYYPNIDRGAMVTEGYVASRSSHSRGGAIDLTLYRLDSGALLPMGGDFDFMDERSRHAAKGLPRREARNRRLLRSVMETCGFKPYEREWWHYVLRDEPYPDRYFDFPVA